jgi:hypothetical protein
MARAHSEAAGDAQRRSTVSPSREHIELVRVRVAA